MSNAIVIPSNRQASMVDLLKAWQDLQEFDDVYVVEDGPAKTFDLPSNFHHYSWPEIEEAVGDPELAWRIFSKEDSAIRCFGFWQAARDGHAHTFTIDDDCYPGGRKGDEPLTPKQFIQAHLNAIHSSEIWATSIPGMRTRGLPYQSGATSEHHVVANMGLWTHGADLDSVQSLNEQGVLIAPLTPVAKDTFYPPIGTRLMPPGQLFPFCGMNVCFRTAHTALMYFPLMGKHSPYKRFDDIWGGVVLKTVCDHLGYYLSIGEPFVKHVRASDAFINIVKEGPGIADNEIYWRTVHYARLSSAYQNLAHHDADRAVMSGMADILDQASHYRNKHVERPYLLTWANGIRGWLALLKRSDDDPKSDSSNDQNSERTLSIAV